MLIEDFVNNVLDNISYCEDYLLYLRANNLISDKDELNYIIDDIQNELWSYYKKDISFSEFAKTDAFYNILGSLITVKSFIDTLKDEELSKCFKTDNDMLMTVGQLKERISENYDIALEEIYKNKEEIER
ncbi:hypothetical protein [Agathobacter rectalis]|uniref:Uncharacterized protein n=1 Tax=Agathobacter rectalis TaxID=39491 RepID=A0A3E4YKZ2_9FIRM|nr:hypothetical protein [Agathobacter rectalis]RGM75370.1 hypothetical protein DXB99_02265 [Agathobacter rectalis]